MRSNLFIWKRKRAAGIRRERVIKSTVISKFKRDKEGEKYGR